MSSDREVRVVAAARMLVRAATAESQARLRDRGFGELTPIDCVIVAQLLAYGASRATDIAARMGISKQALQRPLKRIEAGAYAQRVNDPRDARAQLVRLTRIGREAATAVLEVADEIDRDSKAAIEPERLETCKEVLLELANRLT